ncbi:MAG: DUF4080 domain-containing protein [Ruminococcaceae bacterium]|nr:DUF4080 domain-containing protein [Oscillospiraceae bacterium]
MKIVLFALNGSYAHSALSVRCLATALLAAGYESEIIEGNLRDRTRALLAALVEKHADVYGFSCYIWNIDEMLALAADLKALLPACRIVLGGPEVSFATERFKQLPFVDLVITGEGEEQMVAAVRALEAGETLPRVLCGTPDAQFAARGIHYAKTRPVTPLIYYESARGCPFSCSFCLSSASKGVRAKSAAKTLEELAELEQIEGDFTVKLVDRTFNFDRERAKEIWRGLLSKKYTKCYHFEIAAHLLDEESFEILSQFSAGKVRLEIGLQSTNEKTLAAVARHTDADAVLAAARRLTAQNACHVHLDLIAGLPHEDMASFARSFDAAYGACHVLQLGFLKFLYGTAIRRDAATFGAVFEAKAPYTVLKTDVLSFADVCRLHRISDLMERLRDSGRFVHTLYFVLARLPSPFAFYAELDAYLESALGKEIQKISQRDLFWHLSQFAKSRLPADCHEALSAHLRADYATAEVRRPPKGL